MILKGGYLQRFGQIIKVKPAELEAYKSLHKNVWPGVLKTIKDCNIRNYSIYYKDGFLFSYYEYTGNDYNSDMSKMAKDETTLKWWELTTKMQEPLETRAAGEWWAKMEEVFHQE